ncbi:MAG: hypothetical protein WBC70_10080, partial [Candidatus Aminicenantales bacterium]
DGSGGVFINKATLAGGPYRTPREVCAAAEGLPKGKVDLGNIRCPQAAPRPEPPAKTPPAGACILGLT